jgi:hypothetical protein
VGYGGDFNSPEEVIAAAAQKGDDVVITLGDRGTITLENFDLNDLDETDFGFIS